MASVVYSKAFSSINASFSRKENLSLKSNETFGFKKNNELMMKFNLSASRAEVETKKEAIIPNIGKVRRQTADRFRHGATLQGGVRYKQTVVIRSSEVGFDKNATIECILNLLQESAINHLRSLKIVGDGLGVTPGMLENNLTWVYTKLSVEIDNYPTWDDVIEVGTWIGPSGKNAFQKGWTIKNLVTGQILARASSTWMMMNRNTRRLSKIPDEVRVEISPFYSERERKDSCTPKKIEKLIDAKYKNKNMESNRSDVDMSHHINNVKYANWMLEAIPDTIFDKCQLSSITLEFRGECGASETIQSMCQPDKMPEFKFEKYIDQNIFNGYLPYFLEDTPPTIDFTHLLQVERENKNKEIVRGRTTWKRKSTP